MAIYWGLGLVLIQLEISVDTVNYRNNCLSVKKKKVDPAETTVKTRTSYLCIARDWQVLHGIQSAHRQIGENEDATKACGRMR